MAVGMIATLRVNDGRQADFEAAFAKMQEAVKADEPGCLLYTLCRDRDDATTYRVMEQYSDDDAVKVHGKSDGFKAAAAGLAGVMAGAAVIAFVEVVG